MLEHLNIVSQYNSIKEHFDQKAAAEQNAKGLNNVKNVILIYTLFYLVCFVLALYFAHKYLAIKDIRGFEALVIYILAATFNVPFLVFYFISNLLKK